MRPDCSIRIQANGHFDEASSDELAIWLHFDAKYRVEYADRQFTAPSTDQVDLAADDEEIERLARSKREDLLKMHAYRDAIRRSAGAYVLYPGDQHQIPFTEHHEVLPSLGAFVLRPTAHGTLGTSQLEQFLRDVLDHVADQATQHERSRFWRTVAYRGAPLLDRPDRRLPRLGRPPSDALVLCGYVRGRRHADWIDRSGLYNVRAGDRRGAVALDSDVLQASDLLLYGPDTAPTLWSRLGSWFVQSRENLLDVGYPSPGGRVYLCCPIERRDDEPEWLSEVSEHLAGSKQSAKGHSFHRFMATAAQTCRMNRHLTKDQQNGCTGQCLERSQVASQSVRCALSSLDGAADGQPARWMPSCHASIHCIPLRALLGDSASQTWGRSLKRTCTALDGYCGRGGTQLPASLS